LWCVSLDTNNIRKAAVKDFPELKGLVKELYETLENKEDMAVLLNQNKYIEILNDPNIEVLVAELDNTVVGYITLNFNRSLLNSGTTVIIHELVVTSELRNKGVGKELVNEAIERSKQLGCTEIGVGTEFTNEHARKFYKDCGFDELGVIFEKHLS